MNEKLKMESLELLPQHQKLIEDSLISPEIAAERGYRSVTTKVALRDAGFYDYQRLVPGLLIPIWDVTGSIATYHLRPDKPRIKDNKPLKYEAPGGSLMVLDVHPTIREWVRDPSIPLIITEGIRKADAAVSQGLCCIGLLGTWIFRATNEYGGKTALPDWESIALNGRKVYICFDSDVMEKPGVHQAMSRLKPFLEQRKASVSIIYLPNGPRGEKVGLDDFLAGGHSKEELFSLAAGELRPLAVEEDANLRYFQTDDGIILRKPSNNGTVDIRLTNFTAKILSERCEDDGIDASMCFDMKATLKGTTKQFSLTATQFSAMNWPVEHLGAGAVIYPGFNCKEHARVGIQLLSDEMSQRRVYTHTGWREIEGVWVYLTAGGAIGPNGIVEGADVNLPDSLSGFSLTQSPPQDQLSSAIQASLGILDLAPDIITIPLFAAIWRAVLGGSDFSLHIAGSTGSGKSELAALVQQHWGPKMDARHLPASWSSTGNSLEGLAFSAKDAILTVDDFCPTGSSVDIAKLHREADRIFRAQGNNSGRQRMRSDATLKAAKPPRGLIISTGEDIPLGHSLRSRLLIIEIELGSLDFEKLTQCQQDAMSGLYATALAGFVQKVAGRHNAICEHLRRQVIKLREKASPCIEHRRTPEIVANLMSGMDLFVKFALNEKAISKEDAESLIDRTWNALMQAALHQEQHQGVSKPTERFLQCLTAAITNGRAHIAGKDGLTPSNPGAWGWREIETGSSSEWRASGDLIGWVNGDDLYLEPDSAFAVAERMARDTGGSITVQSRTLHKRLRESNLLVSTDDTRTTNTVRKVIAGVRREVLHLKASTIRCVESDQTDHEVTPRLENGQYLYEFGSCGDDE